MITIEKVFESVDNYDEFTKAVDKEGLPEEDAINFWVEKTFEV